MKIVNKNTGGIVFLQDLVRIEKGLGRQILPELKQKGEVEVRIGEHAFPLVLVKGERELLPMEMEALKNGGYNPEDFVA